MRMRRAITMMISVSNCSTDTKHSLTSYLDDFIDDINDADTAGPSNLSRDFRWNWNVRGERNRETHVDDDVPHDAPIGRGFVTEEPRTGDASLDRHLPDFPPGIPFLRICEPTGWGLFRVPCRVRNQI
jgi:hypothetical protein